MTTAGMVRQEGLEPPAYWFVASHSIQLSYWRISKSSPFFRTLDHYSMSMKFCQPFHKRKEKPPATGGT